MKSRKFKSIISFLLNLCLIVQSFCACSKDKNILPDDPLQEEGTGKTGIANPGWENSALFGTEYLAGRMNPNIIPELLPRNSVDPLPIETFQLNPKGMPIDTAKLHKQFRFLKELGINFLVVEWWRMSGSGTFLPDGPDDYITTINCAAANQMLVSPLMAREILNPRLPLETYLSILEIEVFEILHIYPRDPLLRLYDYNGQARVVIMLHEVPPCPPGAEEEYAASFAKSAENIFRRIHVLVGFTFARFLKDLPNEKEIKAWKDTPCFLAFYPLWGLTSTYAQIRDTHAARINYYELLKSSGLPVIPSVFPGMIFPKVPPYNQPGIVGFTPEFMEKETKLAEKYANMKIVNFDIFNGLQEGRGFFPTKQERTLTPDWVKATIDSLKNTFKKQ